MNDNDLLKLILTKILKRKTFMKLEINYNSATITAVFCPEGLPECIGEVEASCDLTDDNLMAMHEYGANLAIKKASSAAAE